MIMIERIKHVKNNPTWISSLCLRILTVRWDWTCTDMSDARQFLDTIERCFHEDTILVRNAQQHIDCMYRLERFEDRINIYSNADKLYLSFTIKDTNVYDGK